MSVKIIGAWIYLTKATEKGFSLQTSPNEFWGTKDGLTRDYYLNLTNKFASFFKENNPIDVNFKVEDFGGNTRKIIHVEATSLYDLLDADPKYAEKVSATGDILKIQITFLQNNKEYKFFSIRENGWRVYETYTGNLIGANSGNNIFILTTQGWTTADTPQNVGDAVARVLQAAGVPEGTAREAGKLGEKGAEAAKKLYKLSKAIVLVPDSSDAATKAQQNKYNKRNKLTEKVQKCLIRFAGGNVDKENLNKPYDLVNNGLPGFQAWRDATGKTKGPVVGPIRPAYDDRMRRAVNLLRNSINSYNLEKMSLEPNTEDYTLNTIDDKGVMYLTSVLNNVKGFDDSQACLDALSRATLEENKSFIIKDFEFLSNKNKKIHSTLMEQLKKELRG